MSQRRKAIRQEEVLQSLAALRPGVFALTSLCFRHTFARCIDDLIDGEAELLQQLLKRRRRAELAPRNDAAVYSRVSAPAEAGPRFDRDSSSNGRRKHRFAILYGLPLEKLPARHADDSGLYSFGLQLLVSRNAQLQLGTRAHKDYLGRTIGIGKHVSSLLQSRSGSIFRSVHCRQRLPAEYQCNRVML